jgi:hypothetical protein
MGDVPKFPREIEEGIDEYLLVQRALAVTPESVSLLPIVDGLLAAPVSATEQTARPDSATLGVPGRPGG